MRHPRERARASWIAVAALAAAFAAAPPARADAREVAARVLEQWTVAGARTSAVPARFMFDDETILVPIPPEADGDGDGCTQIAVIGARGLSFRARLSDAPMDPLLPPEPTARASSAAGVLELRRCERGRPAVRHIVVTAEAGRGAVDVVVGRSERPLPPLATLIPERTGGVLPPPPEAGTLPPLVAQDKRADAAEIRARREGADVRERARVRAADDGSGEEELELDAGCHRIEVFGRELSRERPGRRFRLDVDAELRDGDQLLARDRTEAPDARLETCLGATTRLSLVYAGRSALPPRCRDARDLAVARAAPADWGPVARSKMARVMFLRHVAVPADDPVYLAQGATGRRRFRSPSRPARATSRWWASPADTLVSSSSARVGARESTDERGAAEEAALTAFCVRAHESARLEVLARGTGVSWGLALFRVKSGVWEPGR